MDKEERGYANLVDAYDATVEANDAVEDVDTALVASGRKIAERIQEAVDTEMGQDVTKALYLTPHLMNVLREMGATPVSRKALEKEDEKAGGTNGGGKLGKLRAINGGQAG